MKPSPLLILAFALIAAFLLAGCTFWPPQMPPSNMSGMNMTNATGPGMDGTLLPNGLMDYTNATTPGYTHEHADFAVFINGQMLDLNDTVYMTPMPPNGSSCADLPVLAHLHDNDGGVAHKHAPGLTWGYFFSTLGMNINSTCIGLYNGSQYCDASGAPGNASSPVLQAYVNGTPVPDLALVELHQGQKMLISYGTIDNATLSSEIAQIPDRARYESRGPDCLTEGMAEMMPLTPSAFVFNASAFNATYDDVRNRINANQTVTSSDFQALYASAQGAPTKVMSDLDEARWMWGHNLTEHTDHGLEAAYQLAMYNITFVCMQDEAQHLGIYLQYGDYDRAEPDVLRMNRESMPVFLAQTGPNATGAYASVNATEVLVSMRNLVAAIQAGQYDSPQVNASLDYLQTLPC